MYLKPKIIVSRCLGFEPCRWNGKIIPSQAVEELKDNVEYVTVCPEADIGLGVPRNPIDLYDKEGDVRAIQSCSGIDVTDRLRDYANYFLSQHKDVKGFILKSRSPSCGNNTTRIHGRTSCGDGIFTYMIKTLMSNSIITDETCLEEPRSKKLFLEKVSS